MAGNGQKRTGSGLFFSFGFSSTGAGSSFAEEGGETVGGVSSDSDGSPFSAGLKYALTRSENLYFSREKRGKPTICKFFDFLKRFPVQLDASGQFTKQLLGFAVVFTVVDGAQVSDNLKKAKN